MSSTNFTQYRIAIPISSQPAFKIFDEHYKSVNPNYYAFLTTLQISGLALAVRTVMLMSGMPLVNIPLVDSILHWIIGFALSFLQ